MPSMLPRPSMTMPEVFHWLESGWPFGEHQPMRTETYVDQGDFVVRCELPGVDPEKDIHIRVEGNQLEITAERKSEERSSQHSEFHYGTYSRTMLLPDNCNLDEIKAEYEAGILTIRVPQQEGGSSREIPVMRTGK
ncbi:Hsp20/alpha crystallin family protein [Saccharopolyspora rectivirgula]|jgi:HSP20 family protein|uniref:Heat-shock protein n=2 Tax=Saccharopolyspora rectivirgula TaxID=28042 RepID=A0A073B2E2_9PSEU|nr:Hsp20/alpha crystallin family protein [Saccharopolyspora rectivirgula]KEI45785.1 heat-shock protein [Saccharopolyspora rectivirgula]